MVCSLFNEWLRFLEDMQLAGVKRRCKIMILVQITIIFLHLQIPKVHVARY
jgi:hypothetical protein